MTENEKVILFQAKQIVDLEQQVLALTKANVRLEGQNNHHELMRTQQESIIRTFQRRTE